MMPSCTATGRVMSTASSMGSSRPRCLLPGAAPSAAGACGALFRTSVSFVMYSSDISSTLLSEP
eukprot:705739-Pyramimonas_sp.AAC.1